MIITVPPVDLSYPTLGLQVCDWIEQNLVFGPGDLRGQPAVIDDEKRALICRLYEVYPKKHALSGRRRFKRGGISLPKGSGTKARVIPLTPAGARAFKAMPDSTASLITPAISTWA